MATTMVKSRTASVFANLASTPRMVDAAIINTDSLDEYKSQVPQIRERITYVLSLFPSELHIFVRPEIRSLADLAGKKVGETVVIVRGVMQDRSATILQILPKYVRRYQDSMGEMQVRFGAASTVESVQIAQSEAGGEMAPAMA